MGGAERRPNIREMRIFWEKMAKITIFGRFTIVRVCKVVIVGGGGMGLKTRGGTT